MTQAVLVNGKTATWMDHWSIIFLWLTDLDGNHGAVATCSKLDSVPGEAVVFRLRAGDWTGTLPSLTGAEGRQVDTEEIVTHIQFMDAQISAWEAHKQRLEAFALRPDARDLAELHHVTELYIRRLKANRLEALGMLEEAEIKDTPPSSMETTPSNPAADVSSGDSAASSITP